MKRHLIVIGLLIMVAGCGPSSEGTRLASADTAPYRHEEDAEEDQLAVEPPDVAGAACGNAPPGTLCDDGDPCTASSMCREGKCIGTFPTCFDGDPCTADSCMGGSCTHAPVEAEFDCDPDPFGAECSGDGIERWFEHSESGWGALQGGFGDLLSVPPVMTPSATIRRMRDTEGGFVLATVYGPSRLDRSGVQVRMRATPDIIGADPSEYSYDDIENKLKELVHRVTYLADVAPAPSGRLVVLGHGHADASAPEYGKKLASSDWFAVLDSSSKVVQKPVVLKKHATEALSLDLSGGNVFDEEHHVQYIAQGGRVVRIDHDLYAALTPTAVWWSTGKRGPGGWGLTFSLFTSGGLVLLQRELGEFFGGETWNTPTLGVAWLNRLTTNEVVAQLQPSGVLLRIRVTDGKVVGERFPGPYGAYSVFMPGPKVAYRRIVKQHGSWKQEFPDGNAGRKALFWQEILSADAWPVQSAGNETLIVRESPFAGFDKPYHRQCLAAASRSLPHDMIREFDTQHVTVPAVRFMKTDTIFDCIEGLNNGSSQSIRVVETADAMHEVGNINIGQIAFSGSGCSVSVFGIFKWYRAVDGQRSRDASWRKTVRSCPQCEKTNTCCPIPWSALPDKVVIHNVRSNSNTAAFLGAICLTDLSAVGTCSPGCSCEMATN